MKPETNSFMDYVRKHRKFLVYDVETTGFSRTSDRIIEFSAIVMSYSNGRYIREDTFEQYIKPPFVLSDENIAIHGITNEFLSDKPGEAEAFKTIKAFLVKYRDAVICGYNQERFDDEMVNAMFLRNTRTGTWNIIDEIDVFTMVKENVFEKDRKLKTMHDKLCPGVTGITFHNSSDDVIATWNIAIALYNKNVKIKLKTEVVPISMRYWAPGRKNQYLFVIVKKPDGEYAELFYDHYYKAWKSKETDVESIDTDALEEALNDAVADFRKYNGKAFRF